MDLNIVNQNPIGDYPANIRVAQTQEPLDSRGSMPARIADFPGNEVTGTKNDNGDLWFANNDWSYGNHFEAPRAGNYEWLTQLHELGHGLGLKHGHQTGGVSNVALPANHDSMEFSVMTYRSFVGAPDGPYSNEQWSYAQTWMMLDIAALQHIYGASYTTNDGDTVYSWYPYSGRTFVNGVAAIDPGGNRIFATLWDGGGIDTYDLSAYTSDLEVDLRAGAWSRFGDSQLAVLQPDVNPLPPDDTVLARGNIANALLHDDNSASLIENAWGGSGDDYIRGNRVQNVLFGNGGRDQIIGEGGSDWLYGGSGADAIWPGEGIDHVFGGSGSDRISYSTYNSRVFVDLQWNNDIGFAAYSGGYDFIRGVENIDGSRFDDHLVGDNRPNVLRGWDGDDVLQGNEGTDTLFGGRGDDRFVFSNLMDSGSYSPGGRNMDVIRGFEGAGREGGDIIDLHEIDANPAYPGDQALSWGRGLSSVNLFDEGDVTVVRVVVSGFTMRDLLEGRRGAPIGELAMKIVDSDVAAADYSAMDFYL